MKDEEGGGQEQRLVHGLPLSHVPSLATLLCASREGRGEEGGRKRREGGVVDRSQSVLTLNVYVFLQEDDSSYL